MAEVVKTVGRYEVLRELGRGGMAVVYLARQVDLDRLVALKELAAFHAAEADFARRFIRESRMAGSVGHSNVVTVYDYFEHKGTPYIAMEYVERGSLRPYVGRMTLAQIGGVLEGLLAGLTAAEQRGIVHRDLKPENLLVDSDGRIKIADFGIAKATQSTEVSAFMTATGATIGTPPYMAPEQAMAQKVGPWTDLYSVGCVAYDLVTGRPPFADTEAPMAILLRHINEPLTPAAQVADVDPDLSAWIERLTAKDPEQRPPSAEAAWEDLEEILISVVGPRWRRDARLGDVPKRVPGPATPPPPPGTPPPMEGVDLEGTGPDTGDPLPAADESVFETYAPPPPPRPPTPSPVAQPRPTPPQPPPPDEEPTREQYSRRPDVPDGDRAPALASAGAVSLLAVVLIAILAPGDERWNLFAVLSPLEAVGIALGTWTVARGRFPAPFTAGILLGFGLLATAGSIGLLKFAFERLGTGSAVLAIIVLAGALAILTAGLEVMRTVPRGDGRETVDPATLVLGLAGTALAGAALFTRYDGFSSLWSEVGEVDSAEFFLGPAVAVVAVLGTLVVVMAARPRLASGLLIALGSAGALHFLGVIVASWRAIGEVGDIGPAGFIGVLGGLLVAAAGANARR